MLPKQNYTLQELEAEKQRRGSLGSPSSFSLKDLLAEKERRTNKLSSQNIEEEGFIDYAKRGLARHARNIAAGSLDTLDYLATPVREGLNLGAQALGLDYRFKPVGEETAKALDTLTGGYTAPQNAAEKTGEALVRGVSSLPSGLGLGTALKGIKNAPQALQALGNYLKSSNVITPTNIATSAATPGIIQESLNADPENNVQAVLGGLGAGTLIPTVGGLLSLLTKKGRQSAASRTGEFFKVDPAAVETFEKAGITPMLADVSKGNISKLATSKLEHLPFSSEPIRRAKELQRSQVLEGLGQGEYGNNLSRAQASKLVSKGAKKYQKGKQKEFNKMFSQLDTDIQRLGDDTIGIENTNKYFDSVLKNIKTKSQQKRFLTSPLGKMYVDLYETAKQNGGRIPYHDMKERLDQINDIITTHGQIGKVTQGKLKQFSSNLSKDIEHSLDPKFKELGGYSYKNWKEAKKYYAQYAQEEIPKLNEIFKKDKKGAVDAFMDLMANQKKGGEKAKIALQGLSPNDQIDLMDAVNKNLGAQSNGTFSPLVWARKFKALEPESQNILLSPLNKSSQNKVKYIANSIDKIKETLEQANTSKSGYYNSLSNLVSGAGTAATVLLTTGNIVPAATLAGGLFISNRISEKMLTNPKFINWMYKGMKAKDLEHFQRNLERIPKVGKLNKTLQREVQTFQRDLELAEDKEKNKK